MKEKILYAIIAILLVVIASGTTYIIMKTKDNHKEEIKENLKEEREDNRKENDNKEPEEFKISNKETKELLNKVPFSNSGMCNTTIADAYDGKYNDINNINQDILLNMAYYNAPKYVFKANENKVKFNLSICGDTPCEMSEYYQESSINEKLYEMYNLTSFKNKEQATKEGISIPGGKLYYQESFYASYLGCGASHYIKHSKNVYAKKVNDKLEIYEDALFSTSAAYDPDYQSVENKDQMKVYSNTQDMKESKNFIDKFHVEYQDKNYIDDYNLDQYGKFNYTKFKHTFKKNNKGYYWYSTEVIKI